MYDVYNAQMLRGLFLYPETYRSALTISVSRTYNKYLLFTGIVLFDLILFPGLALTGRRRRNHNRIHCVFIVFFNLIEIFMGIHESYQYRPIIEI